MTTTARVPGWQPAAAAVLALAAVTGPVAAGLPALQVAAGALAAGLLTYFMRGRARRRQDLLVGMTAVVLVGVAVSAQVDLLLGVTWLGVLPLGWVLRGEREARRDPETVGQPLPGWQGRAAVALVLLLLVGSVAYAAATVRSWDDLAGYAGPPAAVAIAGVLGSVVVLVRRLWVSRGLEGWSARAEREVPPVQRAVGAERGLDPSARPTGADDASLDRARDHAEMAVLFLGSGPRLEAVQELERLLDVAQEWDGAAPLTRQVRGLDGLVRQGRRSRDRVDTELRRDASEDAV